ncbi:MAG: leucine-rich repeat protein [Aristaeellaceae bacterium]
MSDFVMKNGVLEKYQGQDAHVDIPQGVTSIGERAFKGNSELTSVTIPNSVTSIGAWAFARCGKLTSATLPESVTSMGEMAFYDCRSLTSVTIPKSMTSIGERTFYGCHSLTSVTIPTSVTSIGMYAFSGCSSLTSVTIPESVTSIGAYAFDGCSSLTSVTIPESVTSIGSCVFFGCISLTNVMIPAGVTSIGWCAFRWCSSLTGVTLPDSVTSIEEYAFFGCSALTSITIPASVTSIEKDAFAACSKLTHIILPPQWAKELNRFAPKEGAQLILHTPDITPVSAKYRPGAAAGFAEDNRDCMDDNGKKYLKYIKSNVAKLAPLACEHPALLYLMIREKLIAAKDLDAVTAAVQTAGNAELTAAILEYGHSSVSDKDKAKAQARKDIREENVTNFLFDAEKLEVLRGKTIVVTGKLKTFLSHDELKACLTLAGATLIETLTAEADYLLTNTPNSGTAKNKKAEQLGVKKITEDEFNRMIGRVPASK